MFVFVHASYLMHVGAGSSHTDPVITEPQYCVVYESTAGHWRVVMWRVHVGGGNCEGGASMTAVESVTSSPTFV